MSVHTITVLKKIMVHLELEQIVVYKTAQKSSTSGIVQSRSRSQRDFEIFLHLPQYKLSSPISQLWHILGRFINIAKLE